MSDSVLPPAIFLLGPTASGKTALAMQLCRRLPCDIVSVDSALVYRGLDIGSAKPTASELRQTPHRLIDIRDPGDAYSVADFRHDALIAMAEITQAGRIPLLVGGTMMYFKVLLEGLAPMPSSVKSVRESIEAEASEKGWPALHEQLSDIDPDTAVLLHPNHSQRICRALEVYRLSGKTMSEWRRQQQQQSVPYRICQLAIAPIERAVLHRRIEQRFHQMMEHGLIDEVRALRARGDLHADLPAIRAVGYRQVWAYLAGEYDLQESIRKGISATRQLAKRQLTWLRGWRDLHWLYTDESGMLIANKECALGVPAENGLFVENGKAPLELALKYIDDTLGVVD